MNHGKMYGKLEGFFSENHRECMKFGAPVSFFIIPDICPVLQPMHVTEDSSTQLSNEKKGPWLVGLYRG